MGDNELLICFFRADRAAAVRLESHLRSEPDSRWNVRRVDSVSALFERLERGRPAVVFLDEKDGFDSDLPRRIREISEGSVIAVRSDSPRRTPADRVHEVNQYVPSDLLDSPILTELLASRLDCLRMDLRLKELHGPLSDARDGLRRIIERNADGILIVDSGGKVRFVNPAAEALFGYSSEQLTTSVFGFPVVTGETTQIDIIRPTDSNRTAEMRVSDIVWEGEPCFLASIRDITEQNLARQALKESEARFRQLAENIQEVFWLLRIEPEVRFIYMSPAFEKVWGFDREEIYAEPDVWLQIVHPEDRGSVREAFRDFIDSRRDYSAEYRIRRSDGAVRWVWSKGFAVPDEDGRVIRLAGISQDITQRRIDQERRDLLVRELKTFAYVVSHDLRTPLINLKGFSSELADALEVVRPLLEKAAEYLAEDERRRLTEALDEDVPEALGFITASVSSMAHLINAILRFSRLGRRELLHERLHMNELVEGTRRSLAYQIGREEVEVTVEPLPDIFADRTSIEQILTNIIGNAVSYLDQERPGIIEISAERRMDETIFHFRDNGRGIAKEDQERVFDLFRRAGPEDVPGEGVGLTYVRMLVRRHGGKVWCESEPGVGSVFSFSIPDDFSEPNNFAS